jgi:hypothetical protein
MQFLIGDLGVDGHGFSCHNHALRP